LPSKKSLLLWLDPWVRGLVSFQAFGAKGSASNSSSVRTSGLRPSLHQLRLGTKAAEWHVLLLQRTDENREQIQTLTESLENLTDLARQILTKLQQLTEEKKFASRFSGLCGSFEALALKARSVRGV
jgi:hypothetical protein